MFGGAGVYAEGLCFPIEQDGEVFLKVDAESEPTFSAVGSSPFVYMARGKPVTLSFWRLPAVAHDESNELRRFASLGTRPMLRQSRKRESRPIGRGQKR